MHELPVTQGILDTALTACRQAGAQRIVFIDLVIGTMAGLVDESVQFYFDILSRETAAEGAELRFRRVAAQTHCAACGHSAAVEAPLFPTCPVCGEPVTVSGGREFFVESIEVDDNHPR